MFPARIAIATATEDCQPKDETECNTFDATLKLFEAQPQGTSTVDLRSITSQTFEITHVGTEEIKQGDEVIVGQTVDERWVVLSSTSGGHPRFQFVTLQKINNRQVQVKVLRVHSNAPNLLTNEVLQYGDTVYVNDPFNLWSDIEAGATGWAYLAYEQEDDTSTSEIDEGHPIRYEIEECSLPTNEIKGMVKDCLYPKDQTVQVVVTFDPDSHAGGTTPRDVRSTYPNVDKIPEIQESSPSEGSSYFYINAENPNHLDAIQGTHVTLRRITNRDFSEPENYTCPKSRSSNQTKWEIVQVEKKMARVIQVKYEEGEGESSGSWVYDDERWDGFMTGDADETGPPFDQNPCEEEITGPDNWVCEPADGTIGFARLVINENSTSQEYQVFHTDKDLMGDPPETTPVVQALAFDGCDLNSIYRNVKVFKCDEEGPQISSTSINAVPKTVLTAGALMIGGEDCGACSWRAEKRERTLQYEWDGNAWVLIGGQDACPAGGTLAPNPANEPEPDNANDTLEVTCTFFEWHQYEWCYTGGSSSACNCPSPPSADPTEGATYTGDCTGTYDESIQLCFTYTTEEIYTLPCGSGGGGAPGISCIPLTDCDETESSGGDSP